ncbi:Methyl-CpG-binding domain protein 5 [Ranunculus cassubicifolius]
MAVSDISDLDLKLFAAEATQSNPENMSENGGVSGENGGELEVKTPLPISQRKLDDSPKTESLMLPPTQSKRGRKRAGEGDELAVVLEPENNPDWLPAGWTVVKRTRPGGKSAGSKDTYYLEPITNLQFRSKREVLEYIETGIRRSHKKLKNNENNVRTTPLKIPQPNFDVESCPETIKWFGVTSNSWNPFIGEEMVPEHIRLQWAAMFNPFAHNYE